MRSEASQGSHPGSRLWQSVVALVRAWWHVDQVRISPYEGKLLRLQPPCIVRIGLHNWMLRARRVGSTAEGPYVLYSGDDGVQPCELRVLPTGSGFAAQVWFRTDGRAVELAEDDVVVYG